MFMGFFFKSFQQAHPNTCNESEIWSIVSWPHLVRARSVKVKYLMMLLSEKDQPLPPFKTTLGICYLGELEEREESRGRGRQYKRERKNVLVRIFTLNFIPSFLVASSSHLIMLTQTEHSCIEIEWSHWIDHTGCTIRLPQLEVTVHHHTWWGSQCTTSAQGGGGLPYITDVDARQNFQKQPLKVTILGVAPAKFIP